MQSESKYFRLYLHFRFYAQMKIPFFTGAENLVLNTSRRDRNVCRARKSIQDKYAALSMIAGTACQIEKVHVSIRMWILLKVSYLGFFTSPSFSILVTCVFSNSANNFFILLFFTNLSWSYDLYNV